MIQAKHLYYYVPPCPKCGSRRTGRYIRQPRLLDDELYTIRESLRNGELVRLAPSVPDHNVYCEDCGYEWTAPVPLMLLTSREIANEREDRSTPARYQQFLEEHPRKKKSIAGRIFGLLP